MDGQLLWYCLKVHSRIRTDGVLSMTRSVRRHVSRSLSLTPCISHTRGHTLADAQACTHTRKSLINTTASQKHKQHF